MSDVKELHLILQDLQNQLYAMKSNVKTIQETIFTLQEYNETRCTHTNTTSELNDGDHRRTYMCNDCGLIR